MRIRKGLAVFAAAALVVGFAACDSDDGDGNGNGNGTTDTVSDTNGGDTGGTDTTGPEPDTDDDDDGTTGTDNGTDNGGETTPGDPCDPNPCTDPPAAECDGDEIVTYSGTATCTEVDGEASCGDDYESTTTACDTPPADECNEDGELVTYDAAGTCSEGACEYTGTATACEGEEVCSGGECVEAGEPPTEFAAESSFVASLMFPTEDTGPCCFDFDGDGEVDNGVVDLLDSLSSFLGDTDINTLLAEQIEEGTIAILFEAEGYSDDPTAFLLNGYFGELAEGTDAAAALAGEGEFLVDPASFDITGAPLISFPAAEADSTVTAGPSLFALTVPIAEFGFTLNLTIQQAQIESTVSAGAEQGLAHTDGRLGGLIPLQELANTLNEVANGCECLGIDGPAFNLAAEDKLGCTDEAKGADSQCGDDDGICQDLGDNLGIACTAIGIIKPDIDTDDNGTADHFSVGLLFEAVGASITGLVEAEGAQ